MSTNADVSLLVDACRNGDSYGGLKRFMVSLRSTVDGPHRNEEAAHKMFDEAFRCALIPFDCAASAMELGAFLFVMLSSFGHRGDEFGKKRVDDVQSYFLKTTVQYSSGAWRIAHIRFLYRAREWLRASHVEHAKFAEMLQMLIATSYLALMFLADEAGDDTAAMEGLTAAFDESLLCVEGAEFIKLVMDKMHPRLTEEEKPFLIARAVYGMLAAGAAKNASGKQKALDAVHELLSLWTLSPSAVSFFITDLVTILRSADRSNSLPSEKRPHCVAAAELWKASKNSLSPISDLQWGEIIRSY